MPVCASASSSSRWVRESGVRSAVAWTSTSPPSPVMTTFASTSALESSGIVEVEQRDAVDDAARDRGDAAGQRAALEQALLLQPPHGERERDVAAGDRRAAGAAVGLQHVAVDVDRALAERVEVGDAAQAAADQALDLDRRGRPACPWRCRAACARPWTRGASRTRRSSSPSRGRPSSAGRTPGRDAVQITRVPPHVISAEPVAVRTKPGSIVTGRSSSAARPPLRSRRSVIGAPRPVGLQRDVLDRAERELQEAGAGSAQRLRVAGRQEPVVALRARRVAQPAAAEHVLDLPRDRARPS